MGQYDTTAGDAGSDVSISNNIFNLTFVTDP